MLVFIPAWTWSIPFKLWLCSDIQKSVLTRAGCHWKSDHTSSSTTTPKVILVLQWVTEFRTLHAFSCVKCHCYSSLHYFHTNTFWECLNESAIKYTTLNLVQGGAAVVEDQSHEGLKSRMLAVIGCKQNSLINEMQELFLWRSFGTPWNCVSSGDAF